MQRNYCSNAFLISLSLKPPNSQVDVSNRQVSLSCFARPLHSLNSIGQQVHGIAPWPVEAGPQFVHGANSSLKVKHLVADHLLLTPPPLTWLFNVDDITVVRHISHDERAFCMHVENAG